LRYVRRKPNAATGVVDVSGFEQQRRRELTLAVKLLPPLSFMLRFNARLLVLVIAVTFGTAASSSIDAGFVVENRRILSDVQTGFILPDLKRLQC
jgi:hypothetical protein